MDHTTILALVLAALLGYLLGSVPWGLLIGFINGVDIRTKGSRNIGSTNVTRVLGGGWGKICFILDCLKGLLGVLLGAWLVAKMGVCSPVFAKMAGGAGAILGHCYPVWLKFKGGKGVATGGGAALGLAPYPVILALVLWVILEMRTGVVAIASLGAAAAVLLLSLLFQVTGWSPAGWPVILLFACMVAIIFYRHKENIQRLLEGKENSFRKPAKKAASPEKPEQKK
jgi:acyl phosphate:glycerol-3-phosphate acyltransferase